MQYSNKRHTYTVCRNVNDGAPVLGFQFLCHTFSARFSLLPCVFRANCSQYLCLRREILFTHRHPECKLLHSSNWIQIFS